MGAVREWSAAICLVALAAALLQGLAPNGSMERMVKLVLGAFVLCAMAMPLKNLGVQIAWNFPIEEHTQENTQLQSTVETQMETAARSSIENLVAAELSKMDVKSEKVVVRMDTNADNSIGINRVEVTLAEGYGGDCARAQARLRETLGLEVEVTAHGDGGT